MYSEFTENSRRASVVPKKVMLVGLMNPGEQYRATRHNAGAIALDQLFPDAGYAKVKALEGLVAEATRDNVYFILIKPQTFMNLSGQCVARALQKYKLQSTDLVVLHDEVELAPLEVRHKFGGGHKGHNGLRSIMGFLGSADFHRLRIGVGRPGEERLGIADYVLSKWPASERPLDESLERELARAISAINNA